MNETAEPGDTVVPIPEASAEAAAQAADVKPTLTIEHDMKRPVTLWIAGAVSFLALCALILGLWNGDHFESGSAPSTPAVVEPWLEGEESEVAESEPPPRAVAPTTAAPAGSLPPSCTYFNATHLGDGWCDSFVNTAKCEWDLGDCCNVDVPHFDCKDPAHPNFGKAAARGQYPAPRNPRYFHHGPSSNSFVVQTYNNFYEFGYSKNIFAEAQEASEFFEGPWQIEIGGLVGNPMTVDVRELIAMFHLEERIYRHRCVEAWSIVVPWVGFPMAKLLELVQPQAGAKFVAFQTFMDPEISSKQGSDTRYPWPYVEGITLEEAYNELAFLSVGQYQEPLPPQSGAPIRVTLPWKYGFKSIKSIVKITLVDQEPDCWWKMINKREYGFWANVNPEKPHARWSQSTERHLLVDTSAADRIPTLLFNGYEPYVGHLYDGIDDEEVDLWHRRM